MGLLRCLGNAVRYYIGSPAIAAYDRGVDLGPGDFKYLNTGGGVHPRPGGHTQTGEGRSIDYFTADLHPPCE